MDRLVQAGHEVVVVDNLITGRLTNIQTHLDANRIEFLQQDVSEFLEIEGPVDWVYHFASPASPVDFERFPIQVLKAGALGTHKTLGLAKAKEAKYMLASTSEVYGDPMVNPQPETYWGNVNPIGPRGVYDEAKRYAEAMVMAYHRVHGVDTRIVRFFNTYGPRMRLNDGRVVPNFVRQALSGDPLTVYGDGLQTRSFGFVHDILAGVARLTEVTYHEPINLGTEDERTVIDLAEVVRSLVDPTLAIKHLPAAEDDPRQRRPDLTRARAILGWEPTTDLETGLRETIAFYRNQLLPPSQQPN